MFYTPFTRTLTLSFILLLILPLLLLLLVVRRRRRLLLPLGGLLRLRVLHNYHYNYDFY